MACTQWRRSVAYDATKAAGWGGNEKEEGGHVGPISKGTTRYSKLKEHHTTTMKPKIREAYSALRRGL